MRTAIGETLHFGTDGNARAALLHGWSDPEADYTWSIGHRSALMLRRPPGPHGFLLEVTWGAFLPRPRLRAQPITVSVNGRRVADYRVAADEVAAFPCPPLEGCDPHMLVTFDHPEAETPGAGDARPLALCFRRLRVLPLLEPMPAYSKRTARTRIAALTRASAEDAFVAATGETVAAVAAHFDAIAGNCEMGLALRYFGYESISLLRFGGATARVAIEGLEADFAGIGQNLRPSVADNPIAEWMIQDDFGLLMHTGQSSREISAAHVVTLFRAHIGLMRRKLLEDLEEGVKVFVYSDADRHVAQPMETALALFAALNRRRPVRMLWVCPAHRTEAGLVEEIFPGFWRGSLGLVDGPFVGHFMAGGGWLSVLASAWTLMRQE